MSETLEALSKVVEFNDIHEFMDDAQVDRALELVVKFMTDPSGVPPQQISELIIELQSLSTKFAVLATYYTGIGKDGNKEVQKKNLYYTLRDALNELVQALKYHARSGI